MQSAVHRQKKINTYSNKSAEAGASCLTVVL